MSQAGYEFKNAGLLTAGCLILSIETENAEALAGVVKAANTEAAMTGAPNSFYWSNDMKQIGRLALRQEGLNWNAYYALPDSMAEPIFLGSIRIGAVIDNPTRKLAFMGMMRDLVSDILEAEVGIRPIWGEVTEAPEHEKAGEA